VDTSKNTLIVPTTIIKHADKIAFTKHMRWYMLLLLPLLSLSLQSCNSVFTSDPFQNKTTINGHDVGINQNDQATFKGNIYFTLSHNLYVLNGQKQLTQLTHGIDARDPVVSPNGKWLAFTIYYTNYSNLALMPASGGKYKILLNGNGAYVPNGTNPPKSTYHWYAQPSWASDSEHLLILSNIEKTDFNPGLDAFMLDLMLYQVDINNPGQFTTPTYDGGVGAENDEVAYSTFGDGGLRDPSFRPGHPDQVIYTSYNYDASSQYQVDQINLINVNAIEANLTAGSVYNYRPGVNAIESDPGVPLTAGDITKSATQDISNIMPSFSPDGNTIAYVRRINATQMDLYTMPVANGVTGPASGAPTFNPNDPTNLANALKPYNKSSLLLSGQYISDPIWSPDGTQIIYYSYTKETFDLWLATLDKNPQTGAYSIKAGSQIQLTQANGALDADSRPFWTA
jgi:hypothetical protein